MLEVFCIYIYYYSPKIRSFASSVSYVPLDGQGLTFFCVNYMILTQHELIVQLSPSLCPIGVSHIYQFRLTQHLM